MLCCFALGHASYFRYSYRLTLVLSVSILLSRIPSKLIEFGATATANERIKSLLTLEEELNLRFHSDNLFNYI